MLANKYDSQSLKEIDFSSGVSIQPKLDGIRCLVSKDSCKSRNGRDIVSVPHIVQELSKLVESGITFDGELYNHSLKADFNKITSLVKKTKPSKDDLKESEELVQYHIYDIVMDGDFVTRSNFLISYFNDFIFDYCKLVPTDNVASHEEIEEQMKEYLEGGYEGAIIRKDSGLYEHKRSKNLLKFKEFQDEEFTVLDIQEGLGNWSGKAKRIVCRDEKNGIDFEAGVKGNFEFTADLLKNKDEYVGKPVTVRYFNRTPDNVPRFGVAYTFWPDGVKE
jgi:DNA ligase 1